MNLATWNSCRWSAGVGSWRFSLVQVTLKVRTIQINIIFRGTRRKKKPLFCLPDAARCWFTYIDCARTSLLPTTHMWGCMCRSCKREVGKKILASGTLPSEQKKTQRVSIECVDQGWNVYKKHVVREALQAPKLLSYMTMRAFPKK